MPVPVPTWLPFLTKQVSLAGVVLATRTYLDFDSAVFTATDDAVNDRTTISILTSAITLVGDVTGPITNNTIAAISGASSKTIIRSTSPTLEWAETTASPLLSQAARTTDAAPQDMTVRPQAPWASATGANRTPGSYVVDLQAIVAGGAYPRLKVKYGGTTTAELGPHTSGGAAALYLQATPNSTNFALYSENTNLLVNSPAGGGSIYFQNANVSFMEMTSTGLKLNSASGTFPAFGLLRAKDAQNILAANYSSTDYGLLAFSGGILFVGAKTDSTSPVAQLQLNALSGNIITMVWTGATHWQFTDTAGVPAYAITGYRVDIDPQITQRTQTTDIATRKLSVRAQFAYTSAVTNVDGGVLELGGGDSKDVSTGVKGRVTVITALDTGWKQYTFPSDANQTLSIADSSFNCLNILAGVITAGRTITISRRLANPGQVFVRNNTAFTITIQWLTGGSVTLATNTSALIGSDGTNAVKLVIGT